jgi:putative transposase
MRQEDMRLLARDDVSAEKGHQTLTDAQWRRIEPLIPAARHGGRGRALDMRQVVDAILYLQHSGCGWRRLPGHFPKPSSVRTYYDRWRKDGTWDHIQSVLRLAM